MFHLLGFIQYIVDLIRQFGYIMNVHFVQRMKFERDNLQTNAHTGIHQRLRSTDGIIKTITILLHPELYGT